MQATPLSASIEVERSDSAADCPDAAALTSTVERILQRTLPAPSAESPALTVQVRFSNSAGYTAEVRSLSAKPGERRLQDRGRSCAALGEAVGVAIALLLDKELADADVSAPSEPPAPAAQAPAPEEPRIEKADTPRALELRATLEGGALFGVLSSAAPLLSEQLGVRVQHHLLLDAGFNAALPTSTEYAPGSVRSTLLFASARACYTWGDRFALGPCALLGVGRLRGVGLGYASVQSVDLLWAAVGAGVVAEGPLWGRVYWGLTANAWLPTRRSSFSVENQGTAWASAGVAGGVNARLGFRLW